MRSDRYFIFRVWGGGVAAIHHIDELFPASENAHITYLLTYLLTPCSRVLLEKLADLQLVKKFPAFYGTRRFITAFTTAHHLSLS